MWHSSHHCARTRANGARTPNACRNSSTPVLPPASSPDDPLMEPATVATRLASSAVTPIVKKLFVSEGAGAGLVDKPVRISSLVSFKGEQRTLSEKDLAKLAAELTDRAANAAGPHEAPDERTRRELVLALTAALHSIGDLDMDDVQAVRLGPEGLAPPARVPGGTVGRGGRVLPTTAADGLPAHPELLLAALDLHPAHPHRAGAPARPAREHRRPAAGTRPRTVRRGRPLRAAVRRAHRPQARRTDHLRAGLRPYPRVASGLRLHLAGGHPGHRRTPWTRRPRPPPTACCADHERVLLRGAAGSGKTTLLQWLAVTAARQTYDEHLAHLLGRVPFMLPCAASCATDCRRRRTASCTPSRSSLAGAQPAGWAERVLARGRGAAARRRLDEVPGSQREETRRWLRELMGDFPGNLWLVTSRPSAVREDWLADEGFTELTLAPMSRHDVAAFISRWHNAADADPDLPTRCCPPCAPIPTSAVSPSIRSCAGCCARCTGTGMAPPVRPQGPLRRGARRCCWSGGTGSAPCPCRTGCGCRRTRRSSCFSGLRTG